MLSNGNNGQPYKDRLKVADVLLHYGKDLSQSRLGLIRSPFRDERTPSFHIWKTRARVTPRADKALTPDIFYD